MKKTVAVLFTLLFFALTREADTPATAVQAPILAFPSKTPRMTLPTPLLRAPAQVAPLPKPSIRKSLKGQFSPEPKVVLGKSFVLTRDVGAIARGQYRPKLGTLLSQDSNWAFYRRDPQDGSIPVAYNSSQDRFFPISRVIRVKEVNEELRRELQKEGFEEFHYLAGAQMLFIEATQEDVLKVHQELLDKGLKARLEVLTDPPKAH